VNLWTEMFTWLFFKVLEITYNLHACTVFNGKYVKRRGSIKESAFLGVVQLKFKL